MAFMNKSALVTGGAGTIGGTICEELLKNGVTNLAIVDIIAQEPAVVTKWRKTFSKASICYFQVDVTAQKQLKKCYADFTKSIPSLDLVLNCAGIMEEENFRKTIETNLLGVIASTMLAMEYMRKDKGHGKGGIILNIASIAGLWPMSILPFYCAAKHGVVAFTRSLSHDREYLGIKFIVLCPASTQSPLYDKLKDGSGFFMATQEKLNAVGVEHPAQSPTELVREIMKIIQEAKSGSVWVVDQGKPTNIDLPAIEF
ncbi:alcohol dehydrogenase 1-like [Lutzomyia longipalpis]|uniref:alcohol dehydrogenase 1-like n=1 Tax=Lutzomyia longipalpis TaxID=7200 RepID=UPI0024837F95|nr:alcohol dehydrogenase 1-like [Lutzomyia longipalpis]